MADPTRTKPRYAKAILMAVVKSVKGHPCFQIKKCDKIISKEAATKMSEWK